MSSSVPVVDAIVDVQIAGIALRLHTAAGTDLVALTAHGGSYEAPLPAILAATVARTEGLFLDVGANNGIYSLIASGARPGTRVIAFEPLPSVLEVLRRNIALNELDHQVDVLDIALSDVEGTSTIYLPDPGHGLLETSASLQSDFVDGSQADVFVHTRRLDDVELPDKVSVVKVDIEGFELEFLRGAAETLRVDRPFVFAEMLPPAARKFAEITTIVADLGYVAFRLRPDAAILAHRVVFDNSAWNYGLVPQEQLPLFRVICAEQGLEILAPA